ncbi:multidrug effflux MFS transporter [uncultured Campylobacter sp.]|uniref:multidrug effflux MFS transporter n=1 Tax=uncultured Campylobacter sp. TaxID=218934 RepID=UPI0026128C8D|nr:multidrug effflux MFS transporter [uncultured Campylobacter sp.]
MIKQSKFAKFKLVIILAYMSALAPLSTDMYLPALEKVKASFATSEFYTQLSVASFFIAFALGQLVYGPLSDKFGRKKPLYAGILLFICASLACVSFDSVYAFIFFRFLQALGGCAGVVLARAVINDKFELHEAAAMFALMMVVGSLAPMLAPTFGGFVLEFFPWQAIFTILFALGILLFIFIFFGLDESAEIKSDAAISAAAVARDYGEILRNKEFMRYILGFAVAMSALFAYITGSSFIFLDYYGLSERAFGVVFGINALGMTLVSALNAKLVQKREPAALLNFGLIAMFAMSLILLACSMLGLPFVCFELSLFALLSSLGFIAPNATTLAMALFKGGRSGAASAVLGTTQFAIAGAVSFIVGAVSANEPLLLAGVMIVCALCANAIYFAMREKR